MSTLKGKLKKDLQSGPVDKTDLIVILTHLLFCILIWFIYQSQLLDKEFIKNFASGYLFILPFILIAFFFRKLRKIRFYLIWLTISLIQIYIYSKIKDNPDFVFPRGTAFDGLTGLLPTLVMFQLLRQIFYSIKGKEMIISMQKGRMTLYEKEDKRNITWLDVTFSFILGLTAVLSGPLLTSWEN